MIRPLQASSDQTKLDSHGEHQWDFTAEKLAENISAWAVGSDQGLYNGEQKES